uniref:Uncharacterized protein n=1 Tax=Xenopus tropicalis TaxID=8364 RepID=L7N3K3_XENTR
MCCFFLIILLLLPDIAQGQSNHGCALNLVFTPHYHVDGDFIIAGIVTVNTCYSNFLRDFQRSAVDKVCSNFNVWNYQNVLAFVFAINEINNNPDLLPNITLGFHIVDNCLNEERAISGMLDIISGGNVPTPNYRCGLSHNLVAFVDGISTRLTLLFARMFGMYKVPQISFSSLDPVLSGKIQFPFFYRTVPSDDFQYMAIVTLIKYFSWTWVGILVPDDEFGLKISQLLLEELTRNYICVAFLEFLDQSKVDKEAAHKIADKIKSANVIILYGDRDYVVILQDILYLSQVSEKVWIISSQWDVLIGNDGYFKGLGSFNGSLAFTPHKGAIPGFKEFTSSIKPDLFPNDIFILRAWFELFQCSYIRNATLYNHLCTGNEIIQYERFNEELSYNSYSIYNAVYALAHALHHMHLEKMKPNRNRNDIEAWKLHKYLKNINFTNSGGEKMSTDDYGGIDSKFDILNWVIYSNQTLHSIKVGSYDHQNASQGFIINETLIRWSPAFSQTPRSACSETCLAGYRKTSKVGYPACCYDCIPCPEGQITNVTGKISDTNRSSEQ